MFYHTFCKPFSTTGKTIELAELLDAREQRVCLQQRLLAEFQQPVLSITLLAVGSVKKNALFDYLFAKCLEKVTACFAALAIQPTAQHIRPLDSGHEALFVLPIDPVALKKAMIALEESSPLARLWDLDVIDLSGRSISRTELSFPTRQCLVCAADAKICARARKHQFDEIMAQIQAKAINYAMAEQIAELAHQALLEEAYLTPKPGLVDRANSGAHRDMDLQSFERSANALKPFWRDFVLYGSTTQQTDSLQIFAEIRPLGLQAEQAMLAATAGVNTHKGAIFSFGLACCAIGRLYATKQAVNTASILAFVQEMTKGLSQELADYPKSLPITAGVRLYRAYGVTGARGEAEQGFPLVKQHLHHLQNETPNSPMWQTKLLTLLLNLLSSNADTNVLHRGGMDGLHFVQQQAKRILEEQDTEKRIAKLIEFDTACIERNLSAGGSADLLALTIFFHLLMR
ncbi:triphosphoribosyl-dephospho-CoA synthase CitG [Ursidibacter sp. B-7004-1]